MCKQAVLIAGGRAGSPLIKESGHPLKGLILFEGVPLVHRVARTLLQAGFERVVLVGSELLMEAMSSPPDRILYAVEGHDPVDNLLRGVERLGLSDHDQFFHCAVDLPMITPGAIHNFLEVARSDADVVVGFVQAKEFLGLFPGAPYKPLRFREGRFITASVSVMRVGFLREHATLAHKLAHARKSLPRFLWHLAVQFNHHLLTTGVPMGIRFASGRLSLSELPYIAKRVLGVSLQIHGNACPELAYDIDTPEDFHYARAWLAWQSNSQ